MTQVCIDTLADKQGWSTNTSQYIMDYFNSERCFVFDVDVSIFVTKQTTKQQRQEQKSVVIIYDQRTSYKTPNPTSLTVDYVIEESFVSVASQAEYVAHLQSSYSDYDNVVTASAVTIPVDNTIGRATTPEDEDNGGTNSTGIIVGVVCGVVVVAILVLMLVMYHRRSKTDLDPVESANEYPCWRLGRGK